MPSPPPRTSPTPASPLGAGDDDEFFEAHDITVVSAPSALPIVNPDVCRTQISAMAPTRPPATSEFPSAAKTRAARLLTTVATPAGDPSRRRR